MGGTVGGCLFVAFYQIRLAFSEGLGVPDLIQS